MRLRNKPWATKYIMENSTFAIQNPEYYRGQWGEKIFKNNNPLNIEIGSGKGGFIVALAKKYPNQNFLAIERYPSVLVLALKKIIAENLPNLKIIVFDAIFLPEIFAPKEINKIYLNFSDPWPKVRHEKRRLTNKIYLNFYQIILQDNGEIHFKTDNDQLFNYSLESFKENNWKIVDYTTNLYQSQYLKNNIPTEYEQRFVKLGKNINYLYVRK
ncbi:tRNA (guanosine(46)-N7)-methyltransferase TrmB [Spiroplasma citri]|uniref:tRNA (guanine-N(7)-)-methyltransferase n=1 Tax=Spiroplasma citri TaxID=2133 RepID=A0AAJ4JZ37_SPICI|nr:tRNA (guanosine(46)-N7)-methyltransferase TrmB [Spiroplasma citri]APE75710.1 tRNA (guanine-N7-)-methyltransferase [Spiroplasma citri]QIA69733.1 tRNA (guanosine(46)-N7)-methyltransferase TrmB [Spiroplasma citri]QIA71605.1 tRNA (guanosine(46)-N7)-methyltransferase TrmB [Spiroplasma citri]QIA73714.1 tRNA (guanosine(46)-N7)-methyltransferase TrmB [Spiroplasma citri]QIA75717.1 tRNA (guanosine(46)-N7)-methyltransferase TrmB [Spiroplasma citri]